MAKSRALQIVEQMLKAGWEYDGYLSEELRDGDYDDDPRLDRTHEHISVTISFKRRREEGK